MTVAASLALAWSGSLSAQEKLTGPPSPDSAAVQPWRGGLPAGLIPPASPALHSSDSQTLQAGAGPVPVLFAVFGGIAGMFVGDWWMQRDCEENCEERGFLGLLAGGILGTLVGWLIGGGEIPEPPPGR